MFDRAFDDLVAGDRFTSRARTVTETDVGTFAALTGDFHPQHTDADWAASSPFGERIAHGMLVLSLAVGLLPLDPERIVALRRIGDAVFKRPVLFGDTIHVECRLDAVSPVDAGVGLATCLWTIVNQDGRTVARATVDVLWRRAAVPAEAVA
jgi:acyl dehydratase